ncbi:MAG: hypothetical protein LBH95_03270 [Oscillospiraceae bacterium]|jgi:archaellum biogenesis protein FlaJ (TadC family)|nr:hypothetical protein [Oscillospiraceae bacterium]
MNKVKALVFYVGIAALTAGLLLVFLFRSSEGIMVKVPYVMVGCGSGIASVGLVYMSRYKNPQKAKEYEINEKDERNVRLREKAGYATWYVTQIVLMATVFTFLILDYVVPCWIAIGGLFIHNVSFFAAIAAYDKKM